MRKAILFIISLVLFATGYVKAADIKSIGVPYVQNYTKAIYQSGNQNWSVTRDEHGIMYFGNSEGMLTFDGKYWQSYPMPNGLIVRSVAADGKGKVYSGGFGEFGFWENNKSGTLQYHSLTSLVPKNNQPVNEEIWKIYVDNGQVIFQSFGSIYIYKNGKINVIKGPNPFLFLFKTGKRYFVEQVNSGLFELKNNKLEYVAGSNIKVLSVLSGKNPIYSGGNGIANGNLATRTVVGEPIGEFYGYKVTGVFQTQAEVDASSQKNTGTQAGDFIYQDTNKDGSIDSKDRVVIGNPNPKISYGFNTSFNYKQFDLALDFQGVADVDVYNANIAYRFGSENFTQDFYDHRWHGAGTSTTYPSTNVGANNNAKPNSFFVESGAYFRVRNAQLGYTLPGNSLKKYGVSRIRFYANAQNAINIFGYKGFTPEIGGGVGNMGIDADVYPLYATYNFGVNVTF